MLMMGLCHWQLVMRPGVPEIAANMIAGYSLLERLVLIFNDSFNCIHTILITVMIILLKDASLNMCSNAL